MINPTVAIDSSFENKMRHSKRKTRPKGKRNTSISKMVNVRSSGIAVKGHASGYN
jgi:hypothetical protein